VSQPQPGPSQAFAESLAAATARLKKDVDEALKGARQSSPAEAANIAHNALSKLRSAKEAFDADFDASIEQLERVAAGSHEPVPDDGA
jgi:ElaB/YqjD/DUF883 family membrane-anchored ribosome-binding protein